MRGISELRAPGKSSQVFKTASRFVLHTYPNTEFNSAPRVRAHNSLLFLPRTCTHGRSFCLRACVSVYYVTLYGLRCLTRKLRTSGREASASLSRLIVVINSCNIINSVTHTPSSAHARPALIPSLASFPLSMRLRFPKFASHKTGSWAVE